eukprot:CAMPEP_0174716746 /NCGR_PEP_ID=MMETSP1094-20130205/24627_1 /TAXON_ID=156173 /ORGANISM="Chrysochromulina brevifilum, Strain UTEX LB 985" /LENGTH=270 /DNA_ID=CAMNT_0015916565 /DNA_START=82 /DNA_END=892 /DNA_ORIENTATION=+
MTSGQAQQWATHVSPAPQLKQVGNGWQVVVDGVVVREEAKVLERVVLHADTALVESLEDCHGTLFSDATVAELELLERLVLAEHFQQMAEPDVVAVCVVEVNLFDRVVVLQRGRKEGDAHISDVVVIEEELLDALWRVLLPPRFDRVAITLMCLVQEPREHLDRVVLNAFHRERHAARRHDAVLRAADQEFEVCHLVNLLCRLGCADVPLIIPAIARGKRRRPASGVVLTCVPSARVHLDDVLLIVDSLHRLVLTGVKAVILLPLPRPLW